MLILEELCNKKFKTKTCSTFQLRYKFKGYWYILGLVLVKWRATWHFSTVFLQIFYSFSTVFLQFFYSFSTDFLQFFYSFSTVFYNFSTVFLQSFKVCTLAPSTLVWIISVPLHTTQSSVNRIFKIQFCQQKINN